MTKEPEVVDIASDEDDGTAMTNDFPLVTTPNVDMSNGVMMADIPTSYYPQLPGTTSANANLLANSFIPMTSAIHSQPSASHIESNGMQNAFVNMPLL